MKLENLKRNALPTYATTKYGIWKAATQALFPDHHGKAPAEISLNEVEPAKPKITDKRYRLLSPIEAIHPLSDTP